MTTENESLRRRPDGSIDTDRYCALGREARGMQARYLFDVIIKILPAGLAHFAWITAASPGLRRQHQYPSSQPGRRGAGNRYWHTGNRYWHKA